MRRRNIALALAFMICMALLVMAFYSYASEFESELDANRVEVAGYIRDFVINTKDKRYKKADEIAGVIVLAANEFGVDYKALSVILRCESAYQENVRDGVKGERGMGQFMRGGIAQGHARRLGIDLSGWQGQIRGAAAFYKKCFDECGDGFKALNMYVGGGCNKRYRGGVKRDRLVAQWPVAY